MLKESITNTENMVLKHSILDQNTIFKEYEAIIKTLKEELSYCKLEQRKLRFEVETLHKENKNANDNISRSLAEYNNVKCDCIVIDQETITNFEKRITILQMEKDSVLQLWKMSLKAIDALEDELKTVNKGDTKNTQFYQDQINNIKETYSEAIIVLESKLTAAKENFLKQQTVCEKSKDRIDQLSKEKNDITLELNIYQQQSLEKEKHLNETIGSLKENLNELKNELKEIKQSKVSLEERLKHSQKYAAALASKDYESKSKVLEAVDLVESAVKEKDAILIREAQVVEEKVKIETCLAKLSEEYSARLEAEIYKAKETYNKNIKKYLLEIKELKSELREQGTLLDRSQRDYRLIEEELEKVRQGSDDFFLKSNEKIFYLKQNLQEKDCKLQTNDACHKTVYDDRILFLEQKISNLQEKLSNTSDKLRCLQVESFNGSENHIREAKNHTREIIEKCSNFEKQLSKALIDKEYLTNNLQTLEVSFMKEIQKRNHEKILLETRIQELQEKITSSEIIVKVKKPLLDCSLDKQNIDQHSSGHCESITNILALQQKFDKKTKELTQHVETHQKLSNKWKEEANLLTSKFQRHAEEFRNKMSTLQKQNEDLTRELLFYQQLLARCNTKIIQNYNRDLDDR